MMYIKMAKKNWPCNYRLYVTNPKENIGVALINTEETKIGNEIDIMIRNKPVKAVTINKRFYKR